MDAFEILAEVAIGVAGFGSVAIVLDRDRERWMSTDFFRTGALFLTSFGALFLALLPIGLAATSLSEASGWRVSSAVLALYLASSAVLLSRWRRAHLAPELWFGPILMGCVGLTLLANLVAQSLNATGLVYAPNRACYFFGLVWLLGFACLFFVRIVFVRPER